MIFSPFGMALAIILSALTSAPRCSSAQSLFDIEDVDQDTPAAVVQQSGNANRNNNRPGVNLPPKFLPGGDMEGFRIPEDTPVGTIVYRLRGEDPEGSRVGYSISGDHLSVVRNTGAVTLVKPLDHETMPELEVIITLTDEKASNSEPNIVSIRREIIVEDRNDNPPKFSDSAYTFSVNETAQLNAQVFNKIFVSDADSGSNSEVKLTCVKQKTPEACDKFNIRTQRISNGKYAGVLTVRGPLNYEENSRYVMVILAEDSAKEAGASLSSSATVTVQVVDVQDQPPVFLNAPYRAVIQENSRPGQSVIKILVRDGDTGQPRNLQLDVVNDPLGHFRIGSFSMSDGVATATIVTTEMPVDRENDAILRRGGVYTFGLKATELDDGVPTEDFTVENVTVVVTDVNDQAPLFNQESYSVGVPEGLAVGEALPGLDMTVADMDTGMHSQFDLELVPVKNVEAGQFSVHPQSATGQTPVMIRVTGAGQLDYEDPTKREMVLKVVARGGARLLSSTATLTMMLVDVNDNVPAFAQPSYHYSVPENSPPGSLIARLEALDADSGDFGRLRYQLRGFGAEQFAVNETTGDFSVAVCGLKTCLDYEEQDSYTLTFTATDGGGLAASVPVTVTVEDLNDNPPVFEANQYRRHIKNKAFDFDPPLVVKATDKDGGIRRSGANKVIYSIEAGNTADGLFTIGHDDGIIDLTRPINASELGEVRFLLTVRATDSGSPPQHSDTVVMISVGAVDGNDPPAFHQDHYQVNVVEHSPPDSFVIQVNASDPDGPDDALRYRIVGGIGVDWFTIDEVSGIIRVARGGSLQWDQETPLLDLLVAASDQGQPRPQTSTTTITIQVEDINDKPPRFAKELFVHHVAEVTPVGTQVLVLAANDPDTNAQLKFRLLEPFQTRNKGGYLRNATESDLYFTITESTGILALAKPLDHENAAVVMFRVEVTDTNADPAFPNQTDTAEVAIYVQAHTDNGPIFSPPWSPAHAVIRAEIPEEQEPGVILLTLQAHDPLTGLLISNFQLVDSSASSPTTTTTTTSPPETTTDASANRTESTTKGPPDQDVTLESLFDTIKLTDIVAESQLAGINETATQNDPLAIDNHNDTITTSITSLIDLNKLTGEISFKKRIDYEELVNKTLEFQVQAIAGTSPDAERVSLATVKLDIIDTNDNSPQFSQEEYRVRVVESIRYPEVLLEVNATDKDSGKFGEILYTVSGDGADLFVVEDPSSGVIRVAPNVSLDREKQPSYTFTIIATDQAQGSEEQKRTSALVTVTVEDVNDNAPVFTQSSYTAVVPENAPLDWSVSQLQAVDPDEGPGGKVEYSLVGDGRLEGLLIVVPETGNIIVNRSLNGKGRSEPYVLTVRAQDQGDPPFFTDMDVNVYVGDITANDGIPTFLKPAFDEQAFVPEEAPVGSVVFQAVAVDPDDPATPNGRLTYKFLDEGILGTDHASFEIHPGSGLVTTKARLDRESKQSYTLILVARDQGTPSQQATRALHVVVRDIDDHPSQFTRTPYDGPLQFSVLEEVATGWEVDTLKATDLDVGENAAIEYLITYGDDAGLFTLERNPDNSAKLLVKGRIDREVVDHYLLTIKCFKPAEKPSELRKPYNPQDMTEIQVRVTVKDIDDNDPVFSQTNITTGVRLNAPLHTEVLRLEAVDPDADSGPVFYKLVNVSFIRADHYTSNGGDTQVDTSPTVAKAFDLDVNSGSLTTSQTYGLFVDGYFLLHVCAWTGEESRSRKAFTTLRIYILRDSELLKFVFSKPPPEVKPMLGEFRQSVEQSLDLPLTLNLYESQFYSKDGALDFSSTSSCFQLVGKDHVFGLKDTELLLNAERNQRLRGVYDKFGVGNVERCVPRGALYEINNLEIWLLAIGCMIGAIGLIAALTICCLFTRYESRMKKLNPGIHVTEMAMGTGTSRRPSFINAGGQPPMMGGNPDMNHYEGQTTLARSVL